MAISMKSLDTRVTALENKGGTGIGFGQKWYDVTSKRANNVEYTNNTSLPIMVNIFDLNDIEMFFYVDGIKVAQGRGAAGDRTMSTIIPVGSKYKLTNANMSSIRWCELRSNNL